MAKAVVNPDHLNQFASNLRKFTVTLQEQTLSLHRQFTSLGDSWRDQEQLKFAEEFAHMLAALEHFSASAEEQVPLLQRKAAAIEQYLRNR